MSQTPVTAFDDNDDSNTPENTKNVFDLRSLNSLRERLLDLTARNRLLNFKFSTTSQLRIIDELPDQITQLLLNDKKLTFRPVPEPTRQELEQAGYFTLDEANQRVVRVKSDPTAAEWAKVLGLETSYDLPSIPDSDESKHNDSQIQALLFPHELEARLRGIRGKAVTAIEETGSNFLYLAFGFLEWYESTSSSEKRLAPLYMIPVTIEKGRLDPETRRYYYGLSYTGEDIFPNLSLQEKLRRDFHLGLPDLEKYPMPEAYFKALNQVIARDQPRWSVKRQGVLSLLEFSNLLMFLDLDPDNWPQGEGNIINHEIVSRFFSTSEASESEGPERFVDEYQIDELANVHRDYPLIDDADSSQHSVVVDAMQGKSLVVEGPPGTGKSQTITNIIAAAIAQKKSVLFVAEKLAALEVVKRRLDLAGLGDFCLAKV